MFGISFIHFVACMCFRQINCQVFSFIHFLLLVLFRVTGGRSWLSSGERLGKPWVCTSHRADNLSQAYLQLLYNHQLTRWAIFWLLKEAGVTKENREAHLCLNRKLNCWPCCYEAVELSTVSPCSHRISKWNNTLPELKPPPLARRCTAAQVQNMTNI